MLVKAKCCVIWSAKAGAYLETHYQSQQLHNTYQSATGFSLLQYEHGLHVMWPSGPPSIKHKVTQWLHIIFKPAIYFKICSLRWVEAGWQHRREALCPACCFCNMAISAAQSQFSVSKSKILPDPFVRQVPVPTICKAGIALATSIRKDDIQEPRQIQIPVCFVM